MGKISKKALEELKKTLENTPPTPVTPASITDLDKDKLQKYEAIEKEFGCPIDVVLHILKHKDIYVDRAYSRSFSDLDGTSFQKTINLGEACGRIHYDSIDKTFELIFNCWSIKLSDFGRTWARNKEEYLSMYRPYDIYIKLHLNKIKQSSYIQ